MLEEWIKKLSESKEFGIFGIKEKIFFFRELTYLIKGGISILEAVNIIMNTTENAAIKGICMDLAQGLKRGESLHRCFSKVPKFFNDGDVNIIRSGENSGSLVEVLKYLADEYEFLYNVRNKYVGAMIYPALIFLVAIGAVIIIFKYILPGILSILTEFEGVQIPWTTQLLITVTNFFQNQRGLMMTVLVLLVFLVSIILATEDGKKYIDRLLLKVPVFGKIMMMYHLIKYLRYKKLLIYAGMSYVEVFMLLRNIVTHSLYKDMIDDLLESVRRGDRMVDTMVRYKEIIPSDVVALLKVGEESAALVNSIENAIWLYEEEFNRMLDNLSKIIEPFLVIGVGFLVGLVSISVFSIIGSVMDSIKI